MQNGLNTSFSPFEKKNPLMMLRNAMLMLLPIYFSLLHLFDKYFKWYNCSFRRLGRGILLDSFRFRFYSQSSKKKINTYIVCCIRLFYCCLASFFFIFKRALRLYEHKNRAHRTTHDNGKQISHWMGNIHYGAAYFCGILFWIRFVLSKIDRNFCWLKLFVL